MSYRLTHPKHGSVKTNSEHLRDRYLRRGFTWTNKPEPPKPKPAERKAPVPKYEWRKPDEDVSE